MAARDRYNPQRFRIPFSAEVAKSVDVPYLEKTAQSVLVRWFHEGLDAFEHTCPTGRTIYDQVNTELTAYLAAPEETEGFDDLIKSCREKHDALKAQLEQGRDRLLEIHSNGGEKAQASADYSCAVSYCQ
jgi:ATP-dependent helicase HepA